MPNKAMTVVAEQQKCTPIEKSLREAAQFCRWMQAFVSRMTKRGAIVQRNKLMLIDGDADHGIYGILLFASPSGF